MDKVSHHTLNFLRLLVDKNREKLVFKIKDEYELLRLEHKNLRKVEVTSAIELTKKQRNDLIEKLKKITGKSVQLEEKVDPQLISGVKVRIGDYVIEDSLQLRLKEIFEKIVK